MQLPQQVRRAIEDRADAIGFPALKRAATALSDAYREKRGTADARLPEAVRVAAYLATRMPATYGAARAALAEVKARLESPAESLLEIGAGTGAAALAARETFASIVRISLIEADPALANAGREWLPEAAWTVADVRRMNSFPEHDLVLASYALGELREAEAFEAVSRMWRAARRALVIVEPGTPRGFALVRSIRQRLLAAGARMLAPCPGEGDCPVRDPDWCHFGQRVERSSLHRRLKGGELGYEDEKFSYVAVGREAAALPEARIVRRPQHQPGLVTIETCRGGELRAERVTRRDRDAFRAARSASWGDAWAGAGSSTTITGAE